MSNDTIDHTYNAVKNRLLTAGDSSFTYDFEGQLADIDGNSYTFDAQHRLITIGGPTACQYSYDGAGNRLEAIRDGVTTRYIYDAAGNLLAEADEYNNITRYYIYGLGLLAMVTPSDEVYCYHFNATGSTIALTDGSQEVVNKYAYTPFGIITNQQEAVPQPFKYVGQYGVMTEPNGLQYMRARYYDPQVGRFISEDPLGFGGGDVNFYVYVGNNPLLFIDPWGLCGNNTFWGTVETIGSGIGQAGQGLWNALGNEDLQRGTAQGFIMAGEVAVITHTVVAVKAYALYDVATGGPVTTTAVGIVLTNPQGALDFVQSMFPGTTPTPNWPGVYGAATGKILGTDKW